MPVCTTGPCTIGPNFSSSKEKEVKNWLKQLTRLSHTLWPGRVLSPVMYTVQQRDRFTRFSHYSTTDIFLYKIVLDISSPREDFFNAYYVYYVMSDL